MKSLIKAVAIAAVIATPVAAFAQSNQPLTRAQVREQLIQLEQAGYNPAEVGDADYPQSLQAAEQRVAAQNAATAQQAVPATSGYGASTNGSSQSGTPAQAAPSQSLYTH